MPNQCVQDMTTQKEVSPQVSLQAHPFHLGAGTADSLEGRSCLPWAGLGGLSVSLPAPSDRPGTTLGPETCQSPSPMRLCPLNMSPGGKGHSTQKHEWRTRQCRDEMHILRLWPPQSVRWLVLEQVQQDLKGTWFLVAEEQPNVPSKEPDKQKVHICNPSF